MAEPVARKPSGRNVLPILKVYRQARGERHQLLHLAMGAQMSPLASRASRAEPFLCRRELYRCRSDHFVAIPPRRKREAITDTE